MGAFTSFMGKGLPTAQLLGLVMGTLHRQFVEKDISNFEDFHKAILDIFSTVNAALPGKHYDAPSLKEVEACFKEWNSANESRKKTLFMELMKKMNLSKLDDSTLYMGLITPPAAMAAKRAGETLPQLSLIKAIPDVLFVPSATVLALISVKLSRKVFLGQVAS